jgi:hypothetical protein
MVLKINDWEPRNLSAYFHKTFFYGGEIKENEMGNTCCLRSRCEKFKFIQENFGHET